MMPNLVFSPLWIVLAAARGLLSTQPALDERPEGKARALAQEGEALGLAHNYKGAVRSFRASYALDPQPALLCNIGLSYYGMDAYTHAYLYLSRCFQASPKQPKSAQRVFSYLATFLSQKEYVPLSLAAVPKTAAIYLSHFGPEEAIYGPVMLYVPLGSQTISVVEAGYRPVKKTIALWDQTPHLETLILEPARAEALQAEPSAHHVGQPQKQSLLWPSVTLGVGAASAIAGAVFHVAAQSTRKKLKGPDREEHLSTFKGQRGAAIGLYALGTLTLTTGAYLLWRSLDRDAVEVAVGIGPSLTQGRVAVRWRH